MKTMHVKPAPGGKVRFPGDPARVLKIEGEEVPCTPYWNRRLADQSVVTSSPAKAAKGEK